MSINIKILDLQFRKVTYPKLYFYLRYFNKEYELQYYKALLFTNRKIKLSL